MISIINQRFCEIVTNIVLIGFSLDFGTTREYITCKNHQLQRIEIDFHTEADWN